MTNHFIKLIISGGQTGVDRAALDVAINLKIRHWGFCPPGRKAEDGIISEKYQLIEAPEPADHFDPDAIYKIRTELNVIYSDATLIIVNETPIMGGTLYTCEMAQKHNKLYLEVNISNSVDMEHIVSWVIKNNIHKLNVAGPRASQAHLIYQSSYQFLNRLLNHPLFKHSIEFENKHRAKL